MKAGRKPQMLTDKEAVIMNLLWKHGPMFIREMLDHYPEPKPHFNTVATTVRILESKGYVTHEELGGAHRFTAIATKEGFRKNSLADVIRNYFDNSYKNVVSALVEDSKISAEELREILDIIEKKS